MSDDLANLWATLEGGLDPDVRLGALFALVEGLEPRDASAIARLKALGPSLGVELGQALDRSLFLLRKRAYLAARAAGEPGASGNRFVVTEAQYLGKTDPAERKALVDAAREAEAFYAIPVLSSVVPGEQAPEVLGALAHALGALGPSSVVAILKELSRRDAVAIRTGAIEGLAYQAGFERDRLLVERLADPETELRARALQLLRTTPRDRILKVLEGIPAGRAAGIRRASVAYLREVSTDGRARGLLHAFLSDSEALVSAEALLALAGMRDPAVEPAIAALEASGDAKKLKVAARARQAWATGKPGALTAAPPARDEGEPLSSPGGGPLRGERPTAESAPSPKEDTPGTTPVPAPVGERGDLATKDTVVGPAAAPTTGAAGASELPPPPSPPAEPPPPPAPGPDGPVSVVVPGSSTPPTGNPWTSPAPDAVPEPVPPIPTGPDRPPPRSGRPDLPSGPTAPRDLGVVLPRGSGGSRAVLIGIVLVALGGTGFLAYQAGQVSGRIDKEREKLRIDFNRLAAAVDAYENRVSKQLTATGFDDLVGQELKELPADPWGRAYRFDPIMRRILSAGPDGVPDKGARLERVGIVPDDEVRFLDTLPPPMAVFYKHEGLDRVVVLVPGTHKAEPWRLQDGSGTPIRAALPEGGGKIAYLFRHPDWGDVRAEWSRLRPGDPPTWESPSPLLPEGWTAQSLAWLSGGGTAVAVASDPSGEPGLYRIEPPATPVRVVPELKTPMDVVAHPEEEEVALTALDPTGARRLVLVSLAAGGNPAPRWGPPAEQPTYGPRGKSLFFVGPNPDKRSEFALLAWVEARGPGYAGETRGTVAMSSPDPLSRPVVCVAAKRIAVIRGEKVLAVNPKTGRDTVLLEAPGPITGLVWPFPVRLAE